MLRILWIGNYYVLMLVLCYLALFRLGKKELVSTLCQRKAAITDFGIPRNLFIGILKRAIWLYYAKYI